MLMDTRPGSQARRSPDGTIMNDAEFSHQSGLALTDETAYQSTSGLGTASKSTTDLLLIPPTFPIHKLDHQVNIRNPGNDDVFRDNADQISDSEFFNCMKRGSTVPWSTNPFSVNFAIHSAKPSMAKYYRPPHRRVSRMHLATALDCQARHEAGIGSRKRKAEPVNKSHMSNLSIAALKCDNLEDLVGSNLRLASMSSLASLRKPLHEKQNWSAPVILPDGNYIIPSSFGNGFDGLSKLVMTNIVPCVSMETGCI